MRPYEKHEIDRQKCIKCDTCKVLCPSHAVKIVATVEAAGDAEPKEAVHSDK